MAIEGPLRELGIHDVFQLLDLSRKTGVLSVASELRDDEGVVYFDAGRDHHATQFALSRYGDRCDRYKHNSIPGEHFARLCLRHDSAFHADDNLPRRDQYL